jgi:formate transporter
MQNGFPSIDALLPVEMAEKAEQLGMKKAGNKALTVFVLAMLAGAFIAAGALFVTSATAGLKDMVPFGLIRLISGVCFALGLILVVVGGAELFTGNILLVIAFAGRKITLGALLRNWGIVYLGNFVGALATAALMFVGRQYTFGGGAIGLNMLATGEAKTGLEFWQAVALGIMCNAFVCMAVWLTYSARSTTDKIMAIIFPITAFVAAGFEHSVANMYYIPMALFVKDGAGQAFFDLIGKSPADFPHLTWSNFFLVNLLPVTIGNIIGGAVLVGFVYWFVYLRKAR